MLSNKLRALEFQLSECRDFTACLNLLINELQAIDSKYTSAWLANRLKMPSKGNLTDALKGRRKFPKKYLVPLLEILKIRGLSHTFILKLYDMYRNPGPEEERELEILRKSLRVEYSVAEKELELLDFKVFCAMGLFPKEAPFRGLLRLFPDHSANDIEHSLSRLEAVGAITHTQSGYKVVNAQYLFRSSGRDDASGTRLVRSMLAESEKAVEKYFHSKSSLFGSSVISVDSEEYQKLLENLRQVFLDTQSKMETDKANMLVALNIHCFPMLCTDKAQH